MILENIKEKLKLLPEKPGVYIMYDVNNTVIYVGKAKVLKNRVSQYFHNSIKPEKVMKMVSCVVDFSYIIVNTEIDALSLENNLIKKYKPKYNILLKDDKRYPYIKITKNEDFPTLSISRKLNKTDKFYGPFMAGVNVVDVLEIIKLAFKVRTCKTVITQKGKKPCLNYHIDRCLAPCAHMCKKEEYANQIKGAIRFLEGDFSEVEALLKEKMNFYSQNEEFEMALDFRDKLKMLDKIAQKRLTNMNKYLDADVISYKTNKIYSSVAVLIIRQGSMQGVKSYALTDACQEDSEAITSFVCQFYQNHDIPKELILPESIERELLLEFFKSKEKNVEITCAKQGLKFELLQMAEKNANDYLDKSIDKIKHKEDMTKNACIRLQEILGLKKYPRRMECYDISNISGVDKVGSMVVMTDGESDRQEYRRFKIKTVEGANDFESLKEVLSRRLKKLGTPEEARFPKPDLIIIDGGKGQLSSVKEIFDEMNITDIDLISLAKREEEVFTIFSNLPVIIDKRDYALRMLQRIRDEAHRFAITYFRSIHSKNTLSSLLEEINGIGKTKRLALLDRFKNIDGILGATEEELCKVDGIGKDLAKKIKEYLQENL